MPETSSANQLAAAVEDLITTLQNPHPPTPFLQRRNPTNDAICQLKIIFNVPNQNKNNSGSNNQLGTEQSVPRVSYRITNGFQRMTSAPGTNNWTNNGTNNTTDGNLRVQIAPRNNNNNCPPRVRMAPRNDNISVTILNQGCV